MTREKMVRLSDQEAEMVDDCGEILFPHGSVPRGAVIGKLADGFQKAQQAEKYP